MTSLFDVMRGAQLRNVRLSDDRPIRQSFLGIAEAYAIAPFDVSCHLGLSTKRKSCVHRHLR
jgi:hypothetical protein